jgi:hypothetical protein
MDIFTRSQTEMTRALAVSFRRLIVVYMYFMIHNSRETEWLRHTNGKKTHEIVPEMRSEDLLVLVASALQPLISPTVGRPSNARAPAGHWPRSLQLQGRLIRHLLHSSE